MTEFYFTISFNGKFIFATQPQHMATVQEYTSLCAFMLASFPRHAGYMVQANKRPTTWQTTTLGGQ